MHFTKSTAMAALAASLPLTLAQTFSECNPMLKSGCPDDTGLNGKTMSTDFTQGKSSSWSMADGTALTYGSQGAEFTITKAGQAPTIQTDFYIFYGRVDVTMKASTGTGIVSSVVFESDTLDEIDWEFLGGVPGAVQSNFFGKGNTTAYDRMQQLPVNAATSTFHTYSVDWTTDAISWIIDGATVRTLSRKDPLTLGGYNYPQTPMRIKLGNWAGGGPGMPKGTVEWAGGETDFNASPFTMYVQSVQITNYNPACSYHYADKSGSSDSIQMDTSSGCTGAYSSSGSGSASGSVSGSASGSASASAGSSSTTVQAPTTSQSVAPISPSSTVSAETSSISKPTSACSSKTSTGTGSVSATHKPHTHTTLTSAVSASTEVPQPGATTSSSSSWTPGADAGSGRNFNSNSDGSGSSNSSITTGSPSATTSSGPLQQTGNAASPALLSSAAAAGSVSVLGIFAAVFLL